VQDMIESGGRTFRYCQSGAPLVAQNVQADAAIGVDVGVVDAGGEVDLGRLEGIVCREVDGQEEDTALEWRVALRSVSTFVGLLDGDFAYRSHDSSLPVKL
jgi:hypothetical protein